MFGLHFGNLKQMLTRNPLKYGDALGLTAGPLSGKVPGMLTSHGIDWQMKANPFVSRDILEKANKIAPFVAAGIATMGGSAAAGAGSSSAGFGAGGLSEELAAGAPAMGSSMPAAQSMMPAAVPETGDPTAPASASAIRQPLWRQLVQNRMSGQSPYRYQQPPRVQPDFVFPEPVTSVMPRSNNGSY